MVSDTQGVTLHTELDLGHQNDDRADVGMVSLSRLVSNSTRLTSALSMGTHAVQQAGCLRDHRPDSYQTTDFVWVTTCTKALQPGNDGETTCCVAYSAGKQPAQVGAGRMANCEGGSGEATYATDSCSCMGAV